MKPNIKDIPFPSRKCTISDDWTYKGMKTIWMENDFIRVGILAGRGSDIFEFRYKPLDLNFMLQLSKGILNPQQQFSQMREDITNDSNDSLKADSVVGVLRKHLSLNDEALDQLISIDFSIIKREDVLTEEAWLSFTIESIVEMLNRE